MKYKMPPKIKLHNKHGKVKSFPTRAPQTSAPQQPAPAPEPASESEAGGSREDQVAALDAQFELELCWCIQELEVSIQDKKLNPKQTQESLSILKVLRNKSQPTVRKRQLMRMHFGDYRSKMAKEEKQAKKINDQISFEKPGTSQEKSTYIRKSFAQTMGDNSFKFNFMKPPDEMIPSNPDHVPSKATDESVKVNDRPQFFNSGKFQFSNEEFKFNFNIDENML